MSAEEKHSQTQEVYNNVPDVPESQEHSEDEVETDQTHKAMALNRQIYLLMHDSEKNGRWSGGLAGLGVGILTTLGVIGAVFLRGHCRRGRP